MVEALVDDLKLADNDEVAVLVNGFGSTPLMELNVLNYAVNKELASKNLKPVRIIVGNYMTSIDMAGASVSLLKLDEELKSYLVAPVDTPSLKINENEEDVDMSLVAKQDEIK